MMTVKELIDYLWDYPKDAEVRILVSEGWCDAYDVSYKENKVIIHGDD